MSRGLWLIRLQWLCLLALQLGCASGCSRALAELESKQGTVERNQADAIRIWKAAEPGTDFYLGDAVRTARGSVALLQLEGGGRLTVKQNSIVRFANQAPNRKTKSFALESGQAMLEAGDNELLLNTEVGLAHLAARGQMLISRSNDVVKFDVTVGRARIETSAGVDELAPGQAFSISVGRAVIETIRKTEVVDSNEESKVLPTSSASVTPDSDASIRSGASSTTASGVAIWVTGSGVGKKGPTDTKFERLNAGENQLSYGTTLHVEKNSEVALNRDGARVVLMGTGDYHIGANGGLLEMRNGRVSVAGALRIVLPGGAIETKDRTLAMVDSLDKKRSRVQVSRGSATLSDPRHSIDINAGEEGTLNADGTSSLEGRGLGYSDITVRAGESLTIHDPRPPTAVRFRFDTSCPAGGIVRVSSTAKRQFATGQGSVSLALGPGRHEYGLHCIDDNGISSNEVARGTLSVVQDAGTRAVPETPPSSNVTVDGRNYTILYQNQLPNLNVAWPNAPQAPRYKLVVASRNGARTYTAQSPRFSFRSGALAEGRHTIHFEAEGRTSRHTDITITFDNAAPTASLMTPVNPELNANGEVVLLGIAQPGWRVEINDSEVAQDGQRRFSQRLLAPKTDRAVAVKLVHPTRGTHVYLRRVVKPP